MILSHTQIAIVGVLVIIILVSAVLLIYARGGGRDNSSNLNGSLNRIKKRLLAQRPRLRDQQYTPSSVEEERDTTQSEFYNPPAYSASLPDFKAEKVRTLADLYAGIGGKQRIAGLGFIAASVVFLVLSLPLKSVVLEIDSVVSFAVAAILLLKDTRGKVQSRVLSAVVMSLGSTIAGLSSKAGSKFVYSPLGKDVSDVTVIGTREADSAGNFGDSFKIAPPGAGMAKLFLREAHGLPITTDSLNHLLPSMISGNFGLAEGVEITSSSEGVEVLLRKPAIYCSCQTDEPNRSEVVGCTISSFLAVLYSYSNQKTLTLDRCETDPAAGLWRVSMTYQSGLS